MMKRIFIYVSVFLTSGFLFAQSKIAHINVQELLSQMPEMKVVQAELQKLEQSYTNNLQNSMKEFQTKANAYQNEANLLSPEELQKRSAEFEKKAEELQKMDANIQEARQTAAQELQKKQQELLAPIIKKAQDAIEKVAKEKGFDYALDSSPGGSVIVSNGMDLLPYVRKNLGF